MCDFIRLIKTNKGEQQIDYEALANLPVSDKTLSIDGKFADAKATGDLLKSKADANKVYDKETADSKFLTKQEGGKGTVTSIVAGEGLDGGTITESGTISHGNPVGASEGDKGSENIDEVLKSITTDKNGHVTGFKTYKIKDYNLKSVKNLENNQVEIVLSKSDDNNDIVVLKGGENVTVNIDEQNNIIISAKAGEIEEVPKEEFYLELSKKLDQVNIEEAQATDLQPVRKKPDGSLWTKPLDKTGLKLTVYGNPDDEITVADGASIKLKEITTGTSIFELPHPGRWIVYSNSWEGIPLEVVSAVTNFVVDLRKFHAPKAWTVKIDLTNKNPENSCSFVNNLIEAVEFDEMNRGEVVNQEVPSCRIEDTFRLFDIKPCVVTNGIFQYYLDNSNIDYDGLVDGVWQKKDLTGIQDIMIEIPKIGYKIWREGNYQYVSVTNEPDAPGYCYLAHSLEEEGDCDKIYVGLFMGSLKDNKLTSMYNEQSLRNVSLHDARIYASNAGKGYSLVTFHTIVLLQCLYLSLYGNLDGQTAIGLGLTDGTIKTTTGGTVHYIQEGQPGTFGDLTNPSLQMKFLHIEDFWGNGCWWIDGVTTTTDGRIKTTFKNMNDDGTGYLYDEFYGTIDQRGWIGDTFGSNNGGFILRNNGGAQKSNYSDYGSIATSHISNCTFGGSDLKNGKEEAGPFCMNLSFDINETYPYVGARLMYKHKK